MGPDDESRQRRDEGFLDVPVIGPTLVPQVVTEAHSTA
jgi:hypothetical protein